MVSQSYMDTISTISFWTLTIRRFTGWWVTISSQCRFLHGVWTIWFSQFVLLYKKWVFNNGWKRQVWMKQFCCMDKCLNTIFVLPPQQFPRRKTIVVTIFFFDKKKSQWPTSRSQTIRAWHACQVAQQSAFGTTDPKYTMSMRTSWIEGSSCQQTAHNRGQVCFQRTKCFGSQYSQLRRTMVWHKMECHNALTAAYANNQVGISWSFCPAWRRPCVSPLITWVRNTWLAQWKSMW